MKYILIQDEGGGTQIRHEFTMDALDDVLARILYFLRGSSFVIDKYATLEIVEHKLSEKLKK